MKAAPTGLAPRLIAADRLREVLHGAHFLPFTPEEIAEARDRALANRLVTTALRYHGPLTRLIGTLLARGLPKKSGRFEAVLRLSLAQLLFLPELGDHSALFLAGEALREAPDTRHLIKLMNGVLRAAQRQRADVAVTAATLLPATLAADWSAAYGSAALEGFAAALREGAPLDLTLKAPIADAERVLADTVRLVERDCAVEHLPGYAEGRFWVQDAAAALPARLFNLAPGARVLELCAAPGGKTAQLVKAGYEVTALDRDPGRVARLGENLARLDYRAEIVTADALDYRPATPFEGVLLDAPCSATGTFRRHPEVLWQRTAAGIAQRVDLQRNLILNALNYLKTGGLLIYCVCSLEPDEGEGQAKWLAARGFSTVPITAAELEGWSAPITREGWLRTLPGMLVPGAAGGTLDGFFVARFRR